VADPGDGKPGGGGPWGWRTLGVADPGDGGPWGWRAVPPGDSRVRLATTVSRRCQHIEVSQITWRCVVQTRRFVVELLYDLFLYSCALVDKISTDTARLR